MRTRFLFTSGLIFFTGAVAAKSFTERACSLLLTPFRAPALELIVPRAKGAIDLINFRYLRTGTPPRLTWDVPHGVLRVDFAPNQAPKNQTLMALASQLALAYDGRVYYRRESYDPRRPLRPAPPARFLLKVMIPLPEAMMPARRTRPRFGYGPVESGPRPLEMRERELGFDDFVGLLNRADRFAAMTQEVDMVSLEMHAPPAALAEMQRRLKAYDEFYRPRCLAPRILGKYKLL